MNNDGLSKEELDELFGTTSYNKNPDATENKAASSDESEVIVDDHISLDDIEKDILGEIGNISMGTAATTLFALLGQKVNITTPTVRETTIKELADTYELPFISVFVEYSFGIEGVNLLILKEEDVKIMTSLMMGGNGIDDIPDVLTEMHMSAISEAMNQMVGSSSTSLSELIGETIDISPPSISRVDLSTNELKTFKKGKLDIDSKVACTSFKMTVGDLIDSSIMQVLPIKFAKSIAQKIYKPNTSEAGAVDKSDEEKQVQTVEYIEHDKIADKNQENIVSDEKISNLEMQSESDLSSNIAIGSSDIENESEETIPDNLENNSSKEITETDLVETSTRTVTKENVTQKKKTDYSSDVVATGINKERIMSNDNVEESGKVTVKPAHFTTFDSPNFDPAQIPENIDLIKDVMLQVTVELGKTQKPIDEILEFQPGSIIELDKVVGEPLEILANGKKIATGEVVVIDENYGIRITDIVKPDKNKIS